ncbi:J domain-containing protein [Candidatus Woesearchaeota archaeon]|nr:J domain-containing protein [Candidatus Woesearchaeota archaeon]
MTVKGHTFNAFIVKDSFNRRAQGFKNTIIQSLGKIGIREDQTDIVLEAFALKRAPASATWFMDGYRLYYSYNGSLKFVENLYVVMKVIELEVNALLNEEKTAEEFIRAFTEDHDIEEQRKEAREILGVEPDSLDLDLINKKYKELAKEHHPDMGGNPETFKAINRAHKMLRRELE